MKTKIFTRNKNNKIEFTEKQLKDLLDEIYNDGYNDGRNSVNYIYTTPYRGYWYDSTTPVYCTTSTSTSDNTVTINASNTTSGCVLSNNDSENKNEYKWTSTTYKTKK